MYEDVNTVLIAQLEQLGEYWSDLALILQANENIRVDKEFTVGKRKTNSMALSGGLVAP
jgi:hypothetical protein